MSIEVVIATATAWFWGLESLFALWYQSSFWVRAGLAHKRRAKRLRETVRSLDATERIRPLSGDEERTRGVVVADLAATNTNYVKSREFVWVHAVLTALALLGILSASKVNPAVYAWHVFGLVLHVPAFAILVVARSIFIYYTGRLIRLTWYCWKQNDIMERAQQWREIAPQIRP